MLQPLCRPGLLRWGLQVGEGSSPGMGAATPGGSRSGRGPDEKSGNRGGGEWGRGGGLLALLSMGLSSHHRFCSSSIHEVVKAGGRISAERWAVGCV